MVTARGNGSLDGAVARSWAMATCNINVMGIFGRIRKKEKTLHFGKAKALAKAKQIAFWQSQGTRQGKTNCNSTYKGTINS